jgi:hypothetical protein
VGWIQLFQLWGLLESGVFLKFSHYQFPHTEAKGGKMNRIVLFGLLMLVVIQAANAQVKVTGLGYDAGLQQIMVRLGLGDNSLDLGAGFRFDNGASDEDRFAFSLSGYFLAPIKVMGPVAVNLAAGGLFKKLAQTDDNISIIGFAGCQPELTVMENLLLSIRFGLAVPVQPEFVLETTGSGISVTSALSFKIML